MSKVNLTEICNITTGKLDSNAAEENGKYPYFTCAPEPLAINTYAFDDDVILLAGNNASGNFHCQRYKGKFNAYQRTYVITAKDGYDIDYIYYNLKINLAHLKKIAQGSQTKFLTMQILDGFKLEDVGLEEQKRLSKILSKIDNKIELNNKINIELESMAKTIYDYWFLQFEFPNEEGKPYKSSGGKMVWNEELKREIPEGWEVENIFECMDVVYGVPLSTELFDTCKGTPVIRIRDIPNNTTSAFTTEEFDNKFLSKNKDLLIGMDGNFHMNFWATEGDCINQRIVRIRDKKEISALQIFYEIQPYIKAKEKNVARSTVGHLSDQDLKALYILNSHDENIYRTFDKLLSLICKNKKENQELTSLRDFLLPLLMNGQVGFKE